ncbi:DUF748 domain-containing protein [Shewanella aestuarii]|uniref:DUF748 domain-containing protein n=1 Tax=Shewanella aestuarii TaxID=1028752 RepID=A0A6G9QKI9_9GAMM|nr:DUF748 domain-containing protein [Shewanella aestuarii]QIR14389.1 DUF748 domain-containing protein [Shewanella aestuarii]
MTSMLSIFKQRPLYQKLLFIGLSCYGVFCISLGLIAPYIAKKQLAPFITQQIGRETSIEDIRFNPFTFELTVDKFAIAEQNNNQVFIGFDKLYVNASPWKSLFQLSVSLQEATLTAPMFNLERLTEQTFNFSDIANKLQQNDMVTTDSETVQNTSPIAIQIKKINIQQGVVAIKDVVSDSQVIYPKINLEFNDFDSVASTVETSKGTQQKHNLYAISLSDEHGSQLDLTGQFELFPLTVETNITLSQFRLAKYWQFIDEYFDIQLKQGLLNIDSKITVKARAQQPTPFQFVVEDTKIQITDINATHANEEKIVINSIGVNQVNLDNLSKQITIDSFEVNKAKIALNVSTTGADLLTLVMPKSMDSNSNDNTQHSLNEEPPAESRPWLVMLQKVDISEFDVNLGESVASDNTIKWQISQINLQTGMIKSDLSEPLTYNLSAKVNTNSELASLGTINLIDQTLLADFSYKNMHLVALQPYIGKFINVTIEDGIFNTQGKLKVDAKNELNYQGSVWVDQLAIKDNVLHQPLLNWQKMSINQLQFDRQTSTIAIDEIQLDELFSRIIIAEDRSTNISHLLIQNDSEAKQASTSPSIDTTEDSAQSAIAPVISINQIKLTNSSAFFADNSLTPNFASGIELLNGTIKQLTNNPQTTASVNLAGKIDKYAPVTLKGDVNPLLDQPYLDLNLNFKNVELTSVNPYSGTYAGYYIDKGKISLDLTYQLKNNALIGSNHIVIDQLQLGKPSNSDLATSLPVTLAIALLQDRHGVIDLGVDVEGDLNSPSFSFGSIIMGAIGNIITKAVTAPFSLLASLVSSDEPLDKVNFDFGSSQLKSEQSSHLTTLAKALAERPLLIVNLKGSIDAVNDSQTMAETKLHTKLANLAAIEVAQVPDNLSASQFPASGPLTTALYQLYQTEFNQDPEDVKQSILTEVGSENTNQQVALTEEQLSTKWHIALYNLLKNNQQITQTELGILAQNRSKTVKTFLVEQGQIDPKRIFIMESRINTAQELAEVQLELQPN